MPFTSLSTASAADWRRMMAEEQTMPYGPRAAGLLLAMLKQQRDDDCFGVSINTYQHCLQTATRVANAGESPELIVCSLFHDVAEKMAPFAHGAVIADILAPFISEPNEWMLRHHPVFQQYHFVERPSMDRHARDAFRGSPHFAYAENYCEIYDQNSFDPGFATRPLGYFEPIVESYFNRFDKLDSLRRAH